MTPPDVRKTNIAGRLVGYARVPADEQGTRSQRDGRAHCQGCVATSPSSPINPRSSCDCK
jgi:hypothetical protein